PARAVQCAVAMMESLNKLGQEKRSLTLRLGIDTGSVVISGSRRGAARITGTPLNRAAQLGDTAMPGKILASAAVQMLAQTVATFAVKKVIVRVNDEPVHSSEVESVRASLTQGQGTQAASAMVGRSAEVAEIEARLAQAKGGQLQGLIISSEPGMGK